MVESDKAKKRAARDARLAAALRKNLKRRKAQARSREGAAARPSATETAGEGGATEGKNKPRSE